MELGKDKKTDETNGVLYETFLNRGFRFDRRKNRASKMELLNLINTENGNGFKFHGTATKQLNKIKIRLQDATILMVKHLDLDEINKRNLHNFLIELESANNSNDIIRLVDEALYFAQESK